MYVLLDIHRVVRMTGLNRWVIYDRARKNLFPQPLRITTRSSRWQVETVVAWLKENHLPCLCDLDEFLLVNAKSYAVPYKPKYEQLPIELAENDPFELTSIVEHSTKIGRAIDCGKVYFLLLDNVVVYVGQTISTLESRLHWHRKDKEFDAYYVIQCPIKHLKIVESYYIHRLQPVFNARYKNNAVRVSFANRLLSETNMKPIFDEIRLYQLEIADNAEKAAARGLRSGL